MVVEKPVIIVITGGSIKTELGLRLLACLALGYVLVRPMIAFGMTKTIGSITLKLVLPNGEGNWGQNVPVH